VLASSLITSVKILQSSSNDESSNQSIELLVENDNQNILGRHRINPRAEKRSYSEIKREPNPQNGFLRNSSKKSLDLPLKGSKSKNISHPTNNQPRKKTGNREIDTRGVVSSKRDWKDQAISVFCGTPGKIISERRNNSFLNL
jgi:hypothetical protein